MPHLPHNPWEGHVRWLRCYNAGGATVEPFALVRVVGLDEEGVLMVDTPDEDNQDCYVNGVMPILSGSYGMVTRDSPVMVQYDTVSGDAAYGQPWGAAAGNRLAQQDYGGFIADGPVPGVAGLALMHRMDRIVINKSGGGAGAGGGGTGGVGTGVGTVTIPGYDPPPGTVEYGYDTDGELAVVYLYVGDSTWVYWTVTGSGSTGGSGTPSGVGLEIVTKVCPLFTDFDAVTVTDSLASAYTITTDDTWEDSGLQVTLPSAGDWMLHAQLRGVAEVSAGSPGRIRARVYNVTDSVAGTDSECMVVAARQDNIVAEATAPLLFPLTTDTDGEVVRVEVYRPSGPTWVTSEVWSDGDGRSRLTATRGPEQVQLTGIRRRYVTATLPGAVTNLPACEDDPESCCVIGDVVTPETLFGDLEADGWWWPEENEDADSEFGELEAGGTAWGGSNPDGDSEFGDLEADGEDTGV